MVTKNDDAGTRIGPKLNKTKKQQNKTKTQKNKKLKVRRNKTK